MVVPYTVVPGDNLWDIAMAHHETLTNVENDNPQFSRDWDLIHPNDKVYLGGKNPTVSDETRPQSIVTPHDDTNTHRVYHTSNDGAGPLSIQSGTPEENLLTIGRFLVRHGYTKIAAAGITACIAGESGGDPESEGSGGGGLIGWTPLPDGLVTGNSTKDLTTQLHAILDYNSKFGSVAGLNSQASVSAAAWYYSANFERPAVTGSDIRLSEGEAVYQALLIDKPAPRHHKHSIIHHGVNPMRGVSNLQVERVDEGQDYSGNGPIYGIGDGVITSIWGAGWPDGVYILEKVLHGPGAGKYIYFAEDITPKVTIGETVGPNTVIGELHGQMEIGWGTAIPQQTLAAATTGYTEGQITTAGLSFAHFLKTLGAPAGG